MIVMAGLLFGSILLVRNRSERRMGPAVVQSSFRFKDCYDLCLGDPKKEASGYCEAMCASYLGT